MILPSTVLRRKLPRPRLYAHAIAPPVDLAPVVKGMGGSMTQEFTGVNDIRFKIAASGQVESATVSPSALGGTALGGCLVTVAKSTAFPPQEEGVAFSIPIRAQSVPR